MDKEGEALRFSKGFRANRKGESILVTERLGTTTGDITTYLPLPFHASGGSSSAGRGPFLPVPGEKIIGKGGKGGEGGGGRFGGSVLGSVNCQITHRALEEPADLAWLR